MAEIINLRSAKKTLARVKKRAQGDENAAKFARTKAQKSREAAEAEKARTALEGHRRAPETDSDEPPA
ncbi:DUF4169 family protein [Phaeovulum sp. W22_SRMD_FR3]|uniref:DUF4169 family protein n=1 Tax=Phaeovulum sp. W22_SRMD_FR3 TaxID=3240274 RepID=UPI003F9E6F4A